MKTEFMLRLELKLAQESSMIEAAETLRILTLLNGGKPFRSLAFVKKAEPVLDKLSEPLRSRVRDKLSALNRTEPPDSPEQSE
jgi:hypothetical protein